MTTPRGQTLLIMLAAVVVLAVGETSLSRGMKQVDQAPPGWRPQIQATISNAWILAGVLLLAAHLGLYMLALRGADLSFVLPLTAASYPISLILARFFLHEPVGSIRWAGTVLITLGVALISLADANPRSQTAAAAEGASTSER